MDSWRDLSFLKLSVHSFEVPVPDYIVLECNANEMASLFLLRYGYERHLMAVIELQRKGDDADKQSKDESTIDAGDHSEPTTWVRNWIDGPIAYTR